MPTERQIRKLDEMFDGALSERFNHEMDRAMGNVFDPNTCAKAKRRITISIDITPNERRDAAEFKFDVQSKLAHAVPFAQTVLISMSDSGNVTATEITNQVPGQTNMDGETVNPKIIDFGAGKKKEG